MIYGYARVSSVAQKLDRQIYELRQNGVEKIFVDKQSGKDFERAQYCEMLVRLQPGDILYVKSIDRLGRNYKEIMEQWWVITKERQADVVVLDMPLLDTRKEKNLLGTFISDIVLQILSFVAENERAYIRSRAAEGIALAKMRGVKFGRPKRELPRNFEDIVAAWKVNSCTCKQAASAAKMPYTTFRRRALELIETNKKEL